MAAAGGRIIVVTGGAGFIGSHTVEALLADPSIRVRVFDDFSSGTLDNLPDNPRLSVVTGDVRDAAAVRGALDGAEACLHLAAQVSVAASIEDPGHSASINLVGFVNVLDAARRLALRRVVYASSAAVYGVPARLPLDEQAPVLPISPYGQDKLADEHYAALFGRLHGLATLGLRYFNVYGPRQQPDSPYAGVISKFIDCQRRGLAPTVFGDGLQSRDFVHVRDVARANVAALLGDAAGVMNVATGHAVTLLELIRLIGEVAGRVPKAIHAPARDGDIRDSLGDAGRLARELGLQPQLPLAEGLAELLR